MKPGWLKKCRILSIARGARAHLLPGRLDVVEVLAAARIGPVRRGHERDRVAHAVRGHLGDGVGQVGMPVPVAPVQRQVQPAGGEVLPDGREQVPALLVDRADPAEEVVVVGDLGQPLAGHAAAAGDVLQERHDVRRALPGRRRKPARTRRSPPCDPSNQQTPAGVAMPGGHGESPACGPRRAPRSAVDPRVLLGEREHLRHVPGGVVVGEDGAGQPGGGARAGRAQVAGRRTGPRRRDPSRSAGRAHRTR